MPPKVDPTSKKTSVNPVASSSSSNMKVNRVESGIKTAILDKWKKHLLWRDCLFVHQIIQMELPTDTPFIIESDPALFPCTEYRYRYQQTSYFGMEDPDRWGTYFRSTSETTGRVRPLHEGTHVYDNPSLYEKIGTQLSHKGTFINPGSAPAYIESLEKASKVELPRPTKHLPIKSYFSNLSVTLLYDNILAYKNKMCIRLVERFTKDYCPNQKWVFHHNLYPCVIVRMEQIREYEDTDSLNKILLAYYIAIVNKLAERQGIPIELVHRSSFGHYAPSVASINDSFRINVGIVPQVYVAILAEGLFYLNEVVNFLKEKTLIQKLIDDKSADIMQYLSSQIDCWKAELLKIEKEIKRENNKKKKKKETEEEKRKSKKLKRRENFLKNQIKQYERPSEVKKWNWDTKDKDPTYLNILNLKGDKHPREYHSVAHQLVRKRYYVDYLVDLIMKELDLVPKNVSLIDTSYSDVYTTPLSELLKLLVFGSVVTMNKEAIKEHFATSRHVSLKKWQKKENSEIKIDEDFWDIITKIMNGPTSREVIHEKVVLGLYKTLQRENQIFRISTFKKLTDPANTDGYGSDSDYESKEITPKFAKKVIVSTGMEAINVAYYLARYYLKTLSNSNEYRLEKKYTYFETTAAFKVAKKNDDRLAVENKDSKNLIVFFDLNHCDTTGEEEKSLKSYLDELKIDKKGKLIIILDYTSAQIQLVNQAVKDAFEVDKESFLMLLVNSGLKNEQNSDDKNPYGTVRIISHSKDTVRTLYEDVVGVLDKIVVGKQKEFLKRQKVIIPQSREVIAYADYLARYFFKAVKKQKNFDYGYKELTNPLLQKINNNKKLASQNKDSENRLWIFDTRCYSTQDVPSEIVANGGRTLLERGYLLEDRELTNLVDLYDKGDLVEDLIAAWSAALEQSEGQNVIMLLYNTTIEPLIKIVIAELFPSSLKQNKHLRPALLLLVNPELNDENNVEPYGAISIMAMNTVVDSLHDELKSILAKPNVGGLPKISHDLRRGYKNRKYILTNKLIVGSSPEEIRGVHNLLSTLADGEKFDALEINLLTRFNQRLDEWIKNQESEPYVCTPTTVDPSESELKKLYVRFADAALTVINNTIQPGLPYLFQPERQEELKYSSGERLYLRKNLIEIITRIILKNKIQSSDSDGLTEEVIKAVLTDHGFNIPFSREYLEYDGFLIAYLCDSIKASFIYTPK